MKNNVFKNIVIIFSLFAFTVHAGSHMVHGLNHSDSEYSCMCDIEKHCQSCLGDSIVYSSHTFDINTTDFSLKVIIKIVPVEIKMNLPVYAYHNISSLYLSNNILLI